LATEPDRVFTKQELLRELWGSRGTSKLRSLDSHASRTRYKLRGAGAAGFIARWPTSTRSLPIGRTRCEEREGDRSRSRVLGEILNAKVYNLQYPDDPNRKVRADLDDLRTRLNHLREPHGAARAATRSATRQRRARRLDK
jgi:Transcriptional regulatory protein, C terminal